MAEVIQQEYDLVGGAWLFTRVNVANTVHLSQHHSYCLQSENKGRKYRPHEPKTVTDESLTLQLLRPKLFFFVM